MTASNRSLKKVLKLGGYPIYSKPSMFIDKEKLDDFDQWLLQGLAKQNEEDALFGEAFIKEYTTNLHLN